MVVMRSQFCWEWEDVFFFITNSRSNRVQLSPQLNENLKEWNSLDSAIFDYYNRTLWTKIENYPHFQSDLITLKKKIGKLAMFRCNVTKIIYR